MCIQIGLSLTRTSCIEEGLCGQKVLHSLCVHSCVLILTKICSESFHERSRNEFVYCRILVCLVFIVPFSAVEWEWFTW